MSRRSFFVAVGIVVFLTCSVGTALVLLLHYEPGHHQRCAVPPGEHRANLSRTFTREFFDFLSAMTGKDPWSRSFTAEQINSYLAEGFVHSGLSERLLPEGVSEPRVFFEVDRMRLSFRYRSRLFNTVVSIKTRVWLPRNETNIVAVCLEGFQAGMLPCKAQWLLERISEVARQNAIDVTWYRHEGNPVALLRFQADQPRPTLQLTGVQIADGIILISGQANESKVAAPAGPVRLALQDAGSGS